MTNRVEKKFRTLKKVKKKAFIAFLTAGYPTLKATEDLVLAFEKSGVDIIELGVPFSDPLADGPTIQASSQYALKKGVTLKKILNLVADIRRKSEIPILLMTYYNPIFQLGEEQFAKQARRCGVDGVIVPDLPVEEAGNLLKAAKRNRLASVFFVAPTTTKERMKKILKSTSGFVYYVSLTGVTGARRALPADVVRDVRRIKSTTDKPVCVGFGISTPAQIKGLAKTADGIIVGSVLIKEIQKHLNQRNLVVRTAKFVARLAKNL